MAPVVDRELDPRHVQHRHLADVDGRAAGDAPAFLAVHVDAVGTQFPHPLAGVAGGIGRAVQTPLGAVEVDAVGATVAASRDQLVLHVLDLVGVRVLVARGPGCDDPHAAVLVTDIAVGDVGVVVLIVGQVIGIQVLVAAAQDDIALVFQVLFGAIQLVALDRGRLLGAFGTGLDRIASGFVVGAAIEGSNGFLYGAQIPVVGLIVRSERRQAQGDGQRQR